MSRTRPPAVQLTGLNGWRALAALIVILAHVWATMDLEADGLGPGQFNVGVMWVMNNVDIAVDLFFVLSGILIWMPFTVAILNDRVPVPRGGVFFVRRMSRFLPLYLLVVCIQWALHNWNLAKADWIDLIEHLTLTQAWDSKRIFYTVGPAWTLSVEFTFYVVVAITGPTLVRLTRRLGRGPLTRALVFVLATTPVLLGSLAFKAYVAHANIPLTDWAWRFGPPTKADIFVLGMWTGTLIAALSGRKLPALLLPALVAIGVVAYAQVIVPGDFPMSANLYAEATRHTVAALMFCLIMFGLTTSRWQTPARWIDNPFFLPLSVIAYSVYILHEAMIQWVVRFGIFSYQQSVNAYVFNTVIVLLVTIPVAQFFHRTIEVPWGWLSNLMDADGRRREFYPHLQEPDNDDTRLVAHLSNHRRRAGRHFGQNRIVTGVIKSLDAGPASLVEGHQAPPGTHRKEDQ